MKKFDLEDLTMVPPGCFVFGVGLIVFLCWFAYKIAAGAFHLIHNAIN